MRITISKKHVISVLFFLLIIAFVYSVYYAAVKVFYLPFFVLTGEQYLANILEEAKVLEPYLEKGETVKFSNPRQYGPVFLFVSLIFVKLFGSILAAEKAFLIIDYLFLLASFLFCYLYVFKNVYHKITIFMILFILFFNHFAVHYQLMIKNVEFWEVFLIYLAILFYLKKQKLFTGIMIAAASMIKLTPALFFFYFLFKDRKVFVYSLFSLLIILLPSHFILGKEVGLLYIPLLAKSLFSGTTFAVNYFENNSIKGVLYKIFSGFQTTANGYEFNPSPFLETSAVVIYYVLVLVLLGYLVYFIKKFDWNNKKDKLLAEFALVVMLMLLLSPLTSQEHGALLIIPYPVGLYLIFKYRTRLWHKMLFILSFIFTGIFFPYVAYWKFVFWNFIYKVFNVSTNLTMQEAYKAYGFPFIGFALLFVFYFAVSKKIQYQKSLAFKP